MESVKITDTQKEVLTEVIEDIIKDIKNVVTFEELLSYQTQGD